MLCGCWLEYTPVHNFRFSEILLYSFDVFHFHIIELIMSISLQFIISISGFVFMAPTNETLRFWSTILKYQVRT